ncbi:MAG: hypothetical protein IJT57_05600, partial [Selenomonadaceae bacterium]|nr:hypothetical protein [Selenomonadaceae bacterium]
AGKDTITAGAGDDTILGGTGNDELYGGEGSDIFVYKSGDGKDIIWDYREEDKIKITSGTITDTSTEGNDIVYKIGSGSITVKDAANKNISLVDKNNTPINANVPYWFTEDDSNFNAAQLDSIVETSEALSFENSTSLIPIAATGQIEMIFSQSSAAADWSKKIRPRS